MRKMLDSGKRFEQRRVELLRRRQIAPEGLLDHDPRVLDRHRLAECSMTAGNTLGGIAR